MLKYKLEGEIDKLEMFLKLMEEIAQYKPCGNKEATLIEQLLAIEPQKEKLKVYAIYTHQMEATYARYETNLISFLKKHKQAVVRIKGYSIKLTYHYRKVTVCNFFTMPKNFDCQRELSLDIPNY